MEIVQIFLSRYFYVSIQLISPTSGDNILDYSQGEIEAPRFHSINIPNEWGFDALENLLLEVETVSIQLISPTSGDQTET